MDNLRQSLTPLYTVLTGGLSDILWVGLVSLTIHQEIPGLYGPHHLHLPLKAINHLLTTLALWHRTSKDTAA